MTCPWSLDDAAYLLGALPPDERRAYEEHLTTCDSCSTALRDIAGLPGLLARLPAEAVETPEPPPPDMLPRLLAVVEAERRRSRRVRVAAVALAAAAAVAAVFVGVWVVVPAQPPKPVAMSRVIDVPISASVALVDKPWGTEIDLSCQYTGSTRYAPDSYLLVAQDRSGRTEQVATWGVVPDREVKVVGSTSLKRSQLAALEVQTPSGRTVLRVRTT